MLMLLHPLEGEIEGYSREQFLADLCDEVEKDIRQCFAAGAVRVSIDFTEGRLANKNDSRNPWTGKDMLQEFIDLNNRVIDRFSPEERVNIGIHTCPGGDCDSVHSKDVPVREAARRTMFQLNAGYFLIQCASEDDKEKVYKLCGEHSREDANGVPQVCFMGVINPLTPEVETPEQVRDDLVTAAKHIPVERLGATDDCGFSPFSRDVKPKHGSPGLRARHRDAEDRRAARGRADGVRGARGLAPFEQLGDRQRDAVALVRLRGPRGRGADRRAGVAHRDPDPGLAQHADVVLLVADRGERGERDPEPRARGAHGVRLVDVGGDDLEVARMREHAARRGRERVAQRVQGRRSLRLGDDAPQLVGRRRAARQVGRERPAARRSAPPPRRRPARGARRASRPPAYQPTSTPWRVGERERRGGVGPRHRRLGERAAARRSRDRAGT